MTRFRQSVPLLGTLFLLLAVAPAAASDGVTEINQAKVLAGGVTAGDGPGFPVTISTSGSFRLTSNLDLTVLGLPASANTTAIAAGVGIIVSIDLNGFAILGPNNCDGTCTNSGAGSGITGENVSVQGGTISGMGGYGILVGSGLVEDVVVTHNGGVGIFLQRGTVRGAFARLNGAVGIEAVSGLVTASSSSNNLGDGIRAVLIDRSVALSNGADGFEVGSGIVTNSLSDGNGGGEMTCITSCSLTGNRFAGCVGLACFGGAGARTQVPASSNSCGDAVCP